MAKKLKPKEFAQADAGSQAATDLLGTGKFAGCSKMAPWSLWRPEHQLSDVMHLNNDFNGSTIVATFVFIYLFIQSLILFFLLLYCSKDFVGAVDLQGDESGHVGPAVGRVACSGRYHQVGPAHQQSPTPPQGHQPGPPGYPAAAVLRHRKVRTPPLVPTCAPSSIVAGIFTPLPQSLPPSLPPSLAPFLPLGIASDQVSHIILLAAFAIPVSISRTCKRLVEHF